jgi:hypothetical protein
MHHTSPTNTPRTARRPTLGHDLKEGGATPSITGSAELEQLREQLWRTEDAKSRAVADLAVVVHYLRTAPAEVSAELLARVQEVVRRREVATE